MSDVRDDLKDLVLFHSLKENKLITFDEYVTAMSEEQKYIFYATGESVSKIEQLPQADLIKDKGWDILCCTERIDEFTLKMLMSYKDKQFKSIADDDLDIETPEEKEDIKTKSEDSKELFKYMQETLNGKVAEVKLSSRLKNHPVCLTSKGPISIEMEKTLNSMPSQQRVNAERVLEINPEHGVFQSISNAFASGDKDKVAKYTNLLYTQALLIEGLSIENPVEFSNLICELMK
jgi:molecular chaperone HtpG